MSNTALITGPPRAERPLLYTEGFLILTPCGICQERLALWGSDVQVAVPQPGEPNKWLSKSLAEVQPHYWLNAVRDAGE